VYQLVSHKVKLFVATPAYGGWLCEDYLHSMLELQTFCNQEQIPFRIQTLGMESLVTRARNTLVANFLDDEDATHLLFVDADIGFKPQIVKRMLDFDHEVVCAPYPMKLINWSAIPQLVKDDLDYKTLSLPYVLNFKDKDNIEVKQGFANVLDAATGFLLIKKESLLKMVKEYPELHYNTDQILNGKEYDSKNTYLFFDTMKDDDGRYLSEDYAFSRRWQKIGGKIWADLSSELIHYGQYKFQGQLWKHFDKKK
jgi:hypothetical protein|tara:strand:- start:379 stop:1140 length:762 start_codon:yes stop_codon:yes gene_type:complete